MAKLERTYIIPLRSSWMKAPMYRRAKRAVKGAREFLERHMKSENVKLGAHLNEFIWSRGIRNPPPRVKVSAVKEEDGTVKAELFGKEFAEAAETIKTKALAEPAKEKETKKEETKEEKKEEAKAEHKKEEEKKEIKAEHRKEEAKPKVEQKKETKPEPKKEEKKVGAKKTEAKPAPKAKPTKK